MNEKEKRKLSEDILKKAMTQGTTGHGFTLSAREISTIYANPERVKVFYMLLNSVAGQSCCWLGCIRMAGSKATSWKGYVAEQWSDNYFERWLRNEGSFFNQVRPVCKCCKRGGETTEPLKDAKRNGLTFTAFLGSVQGKEYQWPVWPLPASTFGTVVRNKARKQVKRVR